jgi:DNA replication protein DnaC
VLVGDYPLTFPCQPCADATARREREDAEQAQRADRALRLELRKQNIRMHLEAIGVNARKWHDLSPARFDTFDPVPDTGAEKACREYARGFIRGQRGRTLYLTSQRPGEVVAPGSGKTHLAVAILEAIIRHDGKIEPSRDLRFFYVPEMFIGLRGAFDGGESARSRLRRITQPELVVLDDLASKPLTEWEAEQLLIILTEREGRDTIVTSNHTPGQLVGLGPEEQMHRIVSRLSAGSTPVCMTGPDRRL